MDKSAVTRTTSIVSAKVGSGSALRGDHKATRHEKAVHN
jgi:hypothetical protein